MYLKESQQKAAFETSKMVDFAGYGKNITETDLDLFCYRPFLVFILVLNIVLAITATLGNALILFALHTISSIHPPTKLFLRCLVVTDICVGLIVQPLYSVYLLKIILNTNWRIVFLAGTTLTFMLCGVSFLTAAAISVDRLLALLLGLRYRYTVTAKRVGAVIAIFWVSAITNGFIYCFWNAYIANSAAFASTIISAFVSVFSYAKIFLNLRHHRVQAQQRHVCREQANDRGTPLNLARYKRSVHSIALVHMTLAVCFLPLVVYLIMVTTNSESYFLVYIIGPSSRISAYLNSSLNPILYCWKIREVGRAVKRTVKRVCCSSS